MGLTATIRRTATSNSTTSARSVLTIILDTQRIAGALQVVDGLTDERDRAASATPTDAGRRDGLCLARHAPRVGLFLLLLPLDLVGALMAFLVSCDELQRHFTQRRQAPRRALRPSSAVTLAFLYWRTGGTDAKVLHCRGRRGRAAGPGRRSGWARRRTTMYWRPSALLGQPLSGHQGGVLAVALAKLDPSYSPILCPIFAPDQRSGPLTFFVVPDGYLEQ